MGAGYVAETASRVAGSAEEQVNRRIEAMTEASVLRFSRRLDEIEGRLRELREEWDVERWLQSNASVVMTAGHVLGLLSRPLRVLPAVAAYFMFTHAVSGWCPPLPILRRLGVRTLREINRERFALKALRGDFEGAGPSAPGSPAEKARKASEAVLAEPASGLPAAAPVCEDPVTVS